MTSPFASSPALASAFASAPVSTFASAPASCVLACAHVLIRLRTRFHVYTFIPMYIHVCIDPLQGAPGIENIWSCTRRCSMELQLAKRLSPSTSTSTNQRFAPAHPTPHYLLVSLLYFYHCLHCINITPFTALCPLLEYLYTGGGCCLPLSLLLLTRLLPQQKQALDRAAAATAGGTASPAGCRCRCLRDCFSSGLPLPLPLLAGLLPRQGQALDRADASISSTSSRSC